MSDFILTWLLRLLFWGVQLGVLMLIAWVPVRFLTKKRRTAAVLMAVLLLAECALCACVALRPVVDIPEEYAPYISPEELRGYNAGLYSWNIPVFPCCIRVLEADTEEVLVRTYYCFFGATEMSITADGPNMTKPLFPHS